MYYLFSATPYRVRSSCLKLCATRSEDIWTRNESNFIMVHEFLKWDFYIIKHKKFAFTIKFWLDINFKSIEDQFDHSTEKHKFAGGTYFKNPVKYDGRVRITLYFESVKTCRFEQRWRRQIISLWQSTLHFGSRFTACCTSVLCTTVGLKAKKRSKPKGTFFINKCVKICSQKTFGSHEPLLHWVRNLESINECLWTFLLA